METRLTLGARCQVLPWQIEFQCLRRRVLENAYVGEIKIADIELFALCPLKLIGVCAHVVVD